VYRSVRQSVRMEVVAMTTPPCSMLFHMIPHVTERGTAGPMIARRCQQLLLLQMPLAACSSRLGSVGSSSGQSQTPPLVRFVGC